MYNMHTYSDSQERERETSSSKENQEIRILLFHNMLVAILIPENKQTSYKYGVC